MVIDFNQNTSYGLTDGIEWSCEQALKCVRYRQKKPAMKREILRQSGSVGVSKSSPTQYMARVNLASGHEQTHGSRIALRSH